MSAEPNVIAAFIFAPPPFELLAADEGVIFDNEHALLQRVIVPADGWDSAASGADVAALIDDEPSDENGIALIYVSLKSDAVLTPDNPPAAQFYPNAPLELVFENDRVMLQRARIGPMVFEGVHGHPGNQIFVHIKGGTWSAIENGKPTGPEIVRTPGESGWMDAVHEHEYGNVGDTTIDLVWITLK